MTPSLSERLVERTWDLAWCASFAGHLVVGIVRGYLAGPSARADARGLAKEKAGGDDAWLVSAKVEESGSGNDAAKEDALACKNIFRLDAAAPAPCSSEPELCEQSKTEGEAPAKKVADAAASASTPQNRTSKKKRRKRRGRNNKAASKTAVNSPAPHGSPAQSMDL